MEQSPEDWWQASQEVILSLVNATPDHKAGAIAVDGTSATLLLVNDQGRPLTTALMYNDQRAVEQSRFLATMAPPQTVACNPSSSLPKLLWILQHSPPSRPHALHQSEWISGKLCGRFDRGDENNCLKLGYDPLKQHWPDWIKQLHLPSGILPDVLPPGTIIGEVNRACAARTGLPQSCRVVSGTTDSTAAALATGAGLPGDAVTSLGSTLVCKVFSEQPLFSREYGIYSHRIFGKWLAGGASNVGGTVLRRYFSDEELETLSRHIDPRRSLCLNYYPLPARGERFPFNDPEMQPRMTPVPKSRLRFLQGLLEGIARVEKTAYARLQELGAPALKRVFTSGGGAQNLVWMAMRQRLLGTPVLPAGHSQAAYGAARIALKAVSRGE